jgi:hypothetical protein
MICGYLLKSMPRMPVSAPAVWPDCTTSMGMSGRRLPSMSASRANSISPLCGAGWTNVTKARESVGATTVDQSIGGSIGVLSSPIFRFVDAGQESAARECVIDVLEIPAL